MRASLIATAIGAVLIGSAVPLAAPASATIRTPSVRAVSPATGRAAGGVRVTVTGARFSHVSRVLFGSVAGTRVRVLSTTRLTVVTPRHAEGTVHVRVVVRASGTTRTSPRTAHDHYTFHNPPAVTALSSSTGRLTGGGTLTITGSRFLRVSKVLFGSTASRFAVLSSTKLTAPVPAHAAGRVDVRVVGAYGTSAVTAYDRYTYVASPAVTGVRPGASPTTGGAAITVSGHGFTSVTGVQFGTAAGTAVHVVSSTTLTVVAPAHATGSVDVRVSNRYGTSAATAADRLTYVAPGPPPVTALTARSFVGQVNLHWTNPVGTTSVVVRRAVGAVAPATATDGAAVPVSGTATSVADSSVSDFTSYSYSVFAVSADGYAAAASVTRVAPGPVTDTSAEASPGSVTFRWTNPPAVHHLIVQLGAGVYLPPPGQAPTGIDLGAATSYTATGLDARTSYVLTIFAIGADGDVGGEVALDATTPDGDDAPPAVVTNASATPGPNAVVLNWSDPADADLAAVAVARGEGTESPASPTSPWVVGVAPGGARTITDADASPGHTYTYGFWARDTSGNYSPRATLTVTTPKATPSAPVTHLTAQATPPSTSTHTQSVRLSWTNPPGSGALLVARAAGATPPTRNAGAIWRVPVPTDDLVDSGLPAGTEYTYAIWAVSIDGTYSPPTSVTVTTDPNGPRRVIGRVLNSVTRQPVSSVHLRIVVEDRTVTAVSGADGGYELDVPVGVYDLCAAGSPAVGGGASHGYLDGCALVTVGDPDTTRYDVELVPATAVTGRVTDANTGDPLGNVRLSIPTYVGAQVTWTTRTAADGTYTLDGLSDSGSGAVSIDVVASAATGGARQGYLDTFITYPAGTPGATYHRDVALRPKTLVTVTGHLTSAVNGSPIAHVPVYLTPYYPNSAPPPATVTANDGSFTASGVLPTDGSPLYACFDAEGSGDGAVATGFTNRCFGDVDFDLSDATGHSMAVIDGQAIAVSNGQDVSTALYPAATYAGTVTGTDGSVLDGALVWALVAGRDSRMVRTDANGHYLIHTPIRPGTAADDTPRLCADHESPTAQGRAGYLEACRQAPHPTVDQRAYAVDLALAPAGGVTGTVTDSPSGTPLAGVPVTISRANDSTVVSSTTTAADGTYSVIGLDPQSAASGVKVDLDLRHVSGPNGVTYSGQLVGQPPGTVVNLAAGSVTSADRALLRNGSISGVLRGADTGAPLTGVTLLASGVQATTDTDGRFSITGLAPGGHYAVSAPAVAQGPLGYQAGLLQTAPAVNDPGYGWNVTVQPGVDTTVDFRLQPAAAIRVSVVDQSGRPIPGATAGLVRQFGITNESAGDGAGVATIRGLTAQPYDIRDFVCAYALPAPGWSLAYETSCVHEPALAYGRAAPVTIALTPAFGGLTTTVYDAVTGQPVSDANVTYTVVDDAGNPLHQTYGTSDPTGVAAPVLSLPMPLGPPAPQTALHVRFCVQADGYQARCALDDSLDGTSGAVFSTVRGVRTSTGIGLTPA